MKPYKDLSPSLRTIMTPGPVEVDPRVLRAMSYPILGQFDPEFTELMNETMEMLRDVFQTKNQWAFPIDGTSRSGIEAVLVSMIEPGDKVLVPIYGRFGNLLGRNLRSAAVQRLSMIEREWGIGVRARGNHRSDTSGKSRASLRSSTAKHRQVVSNRLMASEQPAVKWMHCSSWMPSPRLAESLLRQTNGCWMRLLAERKSVYPSHPACRQLRITNVSKRR